MQFYFAPMEGITGYIYRKNLNRFFPGMDRYFTPFLSAAKNLNAKQKRDVDPANNVGYELIPQLMCHRAEDAITMHGVLKDRYGYDEINLNFGCPSGTVVSKNHGSGALRDPQALDAFFAELFAKADFPISVKTRIGVESPDEWERLLEVYSKYPFSEMIIHPRTTADFYGGKPRLDAFSQALSAFSEAPFAGAICYNGDINSLSDYIAIREAFPAVDRVMIGRGILKNPALIRTLKTYEETGQALETLTHEDYMAMQAMMGQIRQEYADLFSGDAPVLAHLKELWGYLATSFPEDQKLIKMLKKSRKLAEFDAIVLLLFAEK